MERTHIDLSLTGTCTSDADCPAGNRARCVHRPTMVGPGKPKPGPMVRACVADACLADGDCAASELCLCGVGGADTNVCGDGNCRSDADCGGRDCAVDAWPPMPPSSVPPPRHTPHHCRAAGDTCASVGDCSGAPCVFHQQRRRFECLPRAQPATPALMSTEMRGTAPACAFMSLQFDRRALPTGTSHQAFDSWIVGNADDVRRAAPVGTSPRMFTDTTVSAVHALFDAATQADAMSRCEGTLATYLPKAPRLPLIGSGSATHVSVPCRACQ